MMAVSSSLQFSHELGLCKNHGNSKPFQSLTGQGKLHLLRVSLSSHALRQDSLSVYLSNSIYRRKPSLPNRRNAFKCHALLTPDQVLRLPIIKTASMGLTRSYNALQGSPTVLKLLPAVGIIIFALWGIGPLMRQCRNLVHQKNDNNWKKSSTYYIMNSYLQPILLWTGATLVCRALDPIVLPSEASQLVKQRLLSFVRSLSTVLAFAYCLSSGIQQTQKFFMETNDPSDTRNMGFQFAGKAVYSAVWVAAVSLFMELLGFSTQKWLTAGGLGTVLLTLAGREIFTNFLSSAMIHATRPFVVNEWIQTKIEGYEVSGTVEHVGWWSPTIIRGEDREAVHIPNHKFTVNVVRNLSQKTHWRIKTHLAISHLDVNKINIIVADMRKVLAKNPQVEQQRLHRRVFLDNINPENQALLILVSCFVKTSHFEEYLCVKEAIFLDLLRVISHHRARLATPIRTIQKVYTEADLETSAFSGGVAPNRSVLLIEPPYKVNGEERSKTRGGRSNVEQQDSKTTMSTKPSADTKTDVQVGVTTSESDIKPETKDDRVTGKPTSKPSKVAEISNSDAKPTVGGAVSDNKLPKKTTTTSNAKNDNYTIPPVESGSGKTANYLVINTSRQGDRPSVMQPATPSSVLEENIILGVALEGSKRTLPIEDEMTPTSASPAPEVKEFAAQLTGHGSPPAEKDTKDNQTLGTPTSTSAD